MKSAPILALAAALLLGVAACGGDDDVRDAIAQDFYDSSMGMISEAEAECAADAIIDALGRDQAEVYAAALSGDMEAATNAEPLTQEQQTAMAEGFEACDFAMMQEP